MTSKEKPAHHIRSGVLEVAIWRREGEKGTFYGVTMSRSYKKGDEWKHTDSYSGDDLLLLSKLIDQAHSWIISQPTKRKAA